MQTYNERAVRPAQTVTGRNSEVLGQAGQYESGTVGRHERRRDNRNTEGLDRGKSLEGNKETVGRRGNTDTKTAKTRLEKTFKGRTAPDGVSGKVKDRVYRDQFKLLTKEEQDKAADIIETGGITFRFSNEDDYDVFAMADQANGEITLYPLLYRNLNQERTSGTIPHEILHQCLDSIITEELIGKKAKQYRNKIFNVAKTSADILGWADGYKIKHEDEFFAGVIQELNNPQEEYVVGPLFEYIVYNGHHKDGFILLDKLIQRIAKSPELREKVFQNDDAYHELIVNKAIADKLQGRKALASIVFDNGYYNKKTETLETLREMPTTTLLNRLKNGFNGKPGNQEAYKEGVKTVSFYSTLYNTIQNLALSDNKYPLRRFKERIDYWKEQGYDSRHVRMLQKKIMDNEGIRNQDNATRLAVLGGAIKNFFGSGGRRGGMSFWTQWLDNPRYVFEKHFPKAMSVYELAQKSRLKLENIIVRYNQRYMEVFADLNKEVRKKLEQIVLYADEMGRDPMQVVDLDNGKFAVLDYDGYIEHFEDNKDAVLKLNELKQSGNYKYATSIAERPDDATGKSGNVTVIALSKNSKLFGTREAAEKYAESMFDESARKAISDITEQPHTMSQAKTVIERYKKFRKLMDDVWEEAAREAIKNGAPVPPKRNGYFPHMHLPYVVYEKRENKGGTVDWIRVNSFYTPREAAKYVQKMGKSGKEGRYIKISPIDNLVIQQHYGTNEKLSTAQIEDMKKNELISVRDEEYEDYTNHNGALKSELSRYFQKSNTISIEQAMKAIQRIQSRTPSKDNNTLRKAQMQIKETHIYKKLQYIKDKDTITKDELYTMIQDANSLNKFNPHFKTMTNAPGFSRNVQDSTYRYLMRQANYLAKAEFFAEATSTYKELTHLNFYKDNSTSDMAVFLHEYIKAVNNITSVTTLDKMIDKMVSDIPLVGKLLNKYITDHPYIDGASRAIQMNNILKLGLLNPSSAIVQLSQLLNANAKLGGNKLIGLSKYFRKGLDDAFLHPKESEKKYKKVFDYCGIGGESVALDSELIGKRPGWFEKKILGYKSLTEAANASMWFFNWGDQKARKATAIGGYLKAQDEYAKLSQETKDKMLEVEMGKWERKRKEAKSKKIKFDAPKPTVASVREQYCLKYANNLVTDTNFNYSVSDTPLLLSKLGVTGKLILQFQKYPLFTLNFIKHNTAEENIRFIVPLLLLAGCMGLPCLDAVDEISDTVSGRSPKAFLKEQALLWAGKDPAKRAIANVALYGAPTLTGINLSTRIGLNNAIPTEIGGPTLNTAQDILSGKNPVTAMAPRLGQFWDVGTGQYESSTGNLVANLSVYDRALKALGFKPMTETNASDASGALYRKTKEYRDNLAKAKKEFIEDPNPSTREALRIYGMSNREINKLLLTKDSTSIEKQLKSIPKKSKSEDAQDLRALAEVVQD